MAAPKTQPDNPSARSRLATARRGTAQVVGAMRRYRPHMRELHRELTAGSRVASTTKGPIEYALLGEGPPVLVAHGIGGGYDQGLLVTRLTDDRPFKLICVSRFGYLRTPMPLDASPEAQADAYAALLDSLG